MVWLLPVPGGPCSTKVEPLVAETIAAICELSAGSGNRIAPNGASSSTAAGETSRALRSSGAIARSRSVLTMPWLPSAAPRARISSTSGSFLNE